MEQEPKASLFVPRFRNTLCWLFFFLVPGFWFYISYYPLRREKICRMLAAYVAEKFPPQGNIYSQSRLNSSVFLALVRGSAPFGCRDRAPKELSHTGTLRSFLSKENDTKRIRRKERKSGGEKTRGRDVEWRSVGLTVNERLRRSTRRSTQRSAGKRTQER